MSGNPLFTDWFFQLPNYLLAVLMYMLLGRLVLSFFFQADSANVIWRSFVRVTDPVVAAVGVITPRITPLPVIVLFGAIWMLVLRFVYLTFLLKMGYAPTVPA